MGGVALLVCGIALLVVGRDSSVGRARIALLVEGLDSSVGKGAV